MSYSEKREMKIFSERRKKFAILKKEERKEVGSMKLILAILSNEDSSTANHLLNKNGFQVTKLATTGGFLRAGNTTLMIGCEEDQVEDALKLIEESSRKRSELVPTSAGYDMGRYMNLPMEVQVGGATIFVIDVEQFKKV